MLNWSLLTFRLNNKTSDRQRGYGYHWIKTLTFVDDITFLDVSVALVMHRYHFFTTDPVPILSYPDISCRKDIIISMTLYRPYLFSC